MEKENIIITPTIQTKTIIEIWCVHLSEYLICAKKLYEMHQNKNQNQNQTQIKTQNILFNGIQTMLHVFSILYYKINDVEEYYTQTQRAYLLYLEYLEHVYLKNKTGISPSLFVYNRIFEKTEESNKSNNSDCQLFLQIADWTNFILLRNIPKISFLERHQLTEEFLQDYLLCFCQGNKKQTQEDTQIQAQAQANVQVQTHKDISSWRQTFFEILQNNQ